MALARAFVAILRKSLKEVYASDSPEAGQLSREQVLAWMRTSRTADRIARCGHWQDALELLQAAAARTASPGSDPNLVPDAGASEPPEALYRRARKVLARRARTSLASPLAQPLAVWRVLKRRMGVALAILLAIPLAISTWRALRERDLSPGADWRASSASLSAITGTFPKRHIFANLPAFFVQTEEQSEPSVDIDLHSAHAISRVVVVNRHDCCYDRARGLTLAVSLDGEHYSVIAARDQRSIFRRWEDDVEPVRARYVRVQLPGKRRILHLSDVRVFGR